MCCINLLLFAFWFVFVLHSFFVKLIRYKFILCSCIRESMILMSVSIICPGSAIQSTKKIHNIFNASERRRRFEPKKKKHFFWDGQAGALLSQHAAALSERNVPGDVKVFCNLSIYNVVFSAKLNPRLLEKSLYLLRKVLNDCPCVSNAHKSRYIEYIAASMVRYKRRRSVQIADKLRKFTSSLTQSSEWVCGRVPEFTECSLFHLLCR